MLILALVALSTPQAQETLSPASLLLQAASEAKKELYVFRNYLLSEFILKNLMFSANCFSPALRSERLRLRLRYSSSQQWEWDGQWCRTPRCWPRRTYCRCCWRSLHSRMNTIITGQCPMYNGAFLFLFFRIYHYAKQRLVQ